ncbi:MAG: bifunctional pyr operon transcriptional regulator/uracil phosphoribosyltransferase PyrR [Acidiferrobacterales bacterium]|nr:bifunctional pyr operon transcriptional regulator/uracil phosphoribosyltransferase PyrR [Acidiferrobacterales bacterium]
MADEIKDRSLDAPLVIGIHTGGAWVAEQLHRELCIPTKLGTLDISFYRDDFSRVGLNPKVKSSDLPEGIEDRNIILVDDVLHTGRTIRAALNEIFSYGRPSSVTLAVALERPGRELPIEAAVVGKSIMPSGNEQARVSLKDGQLSYQLVVPDNGEATH